MNNKFSIGVVIAIVLRLVRLYGGQHNKHKQLHNLNQRWQNLQQELPLRKKLH